MKRQSRRQMGILLCIMTRILPLGMREIVQLKKTLQRCFSFLSQHVQYNLKENVVCQPNQELCGSLE